MHEYSANSLQLIAAALLTCLASFPASAQTRKTAGNQSLQHSAAGESNNAPAPPDTKDAVTVGAPPAQETPREWFGQGTPWQTWQRATGDWAAWRSHVEDAGLAFGLSTTVDLSDIGHDRQHEFEGRSLFDWNVKVDLQAIAGIHAGAFFAQYYRKDGSNGSERAGDLQGFSNIDADSFRHVGEFWYEQAFGERFRVKAGRTDANTEFAYVENGAEFLNSSMGVSPTIIALPTYPAPMVGINLFAHPNPHMYLSVGVYNGDDPESARLAHWSSRFSISEIGATWALRRGVLPGRVGVGAWRHNGAFTRLGDDGVFNGTNGTFVIVDQKLWSEAAGGEDGRQAAAFFQLGLADERASEIGRHVGGGVVVTGALPARRHDLLGVGVTAIRLSPFAAAPPAAGQEVNVEAFYRFQLTAWSSVKPDVQVIRSPHGNAAAPTVLAATIRLGIDF